MRRRGLLRDRKDDQARSRIRSPHRSIRSNRVLIKDKVIRHPMGRLLHGIAGFLNLICLCIIVGFICNHIIFNILLCIQIMLYHKDRLFLAMIWSNRILIAAKRMRKAQNKTQIIFSRSGVLQACLTLRSEGCNGCARRSLWNNKWRLYQQGRRP